MPVGGAITGLESSVAGTWYAFKWRGIYRGIRTNDSVNAYEIVCVSKTFGAIPYSVVRGVDESGAACIFFLDPFEGPCRVGQGGVQRIWGLRKTWQRVNLQAQSKIACGCYFPNKQQMRWCVAVDGSNRPNFGITVQVSELRLRDNFSVWRGLSTFTGRMTEASTMEVFTELVSISGVDQVSNRPFVGLTSPDYVQRCDTAATDAGTAFTATIRTKPLAVLGLLQKWGIMIASIMATANAGGSLVCRLVRDFDIEDKEVTASLSPTGSETYVIVPMDDLVLSELTTLQLEFSDV